MASKNYMHGLGVGVGDDDDDGGVEDAADDLITGGESVQSRVAPNSS